MSRKLQQMVTAKFQSTLPSQGATRTRKLPNAPPHISIHAPLTGSDSESIPRSTSHCNFNPRSPHRERPVTRFGRFQRPISIHAPLTGSDFRLVPRRREISHFNPRSPHRERHSMPKNGILRKIFQSTLPSQGATGRTPNVASRVIISIHAPLTGSDFFVRIRRNFRNYFNPRSPHRERP